MLPRSAAEHAPVSPSVSSAEHAPVSPSEAVRRVAGVMSARVGTSWVGIDGRGAAGKTSLAAAIAEAVPGSVTVHLDDFARPGLRGWELVRFTAQVRDPLLAGRPAHYQRWDLGADLGKDWVEILPRQPLVVEGVSATDVRLGLPWALTLWVDAPTEVRLERIRARDPETTMDRWLTDWLPSEETYVRDQHPRGRSDLLVDGTG